MLGREGLSHVGLEVLLKAIIQAISTFTMQCFKLPLGLCNDIESMIKKNNLGPM